jgi:hypothetical protein
MKSVLSLTFLAAIAVTNAGPLLRTPAASLEDPLLIPESHQDHTGHALLEEHQTPAGDMSAPVKFPETSQIPAGLQYLFAGLWILMLGSLPFIMPMVDSKPVTKTQVGVGAAMLIVLFGGFFLFTNIILFQSVHFKSIRPLTIIECIYFMSQVITTVGYGDITPAKVRGQVFVGFYVLGALTVIAMMVSELTDHIALKLKEYKERRFAASHPDHDDKRVRDLKTLIRPEKPSTAPLLQALAVFLVIDICWVIFFSQFPGEGKTVFQALYMSVITLSTVGLGWFTPVTEEGMIFGAFCMLIGTASLVSVVGNFTELMVKMNAYERFKEDCKDEATELLKTVTGGSDSTNVTELQFLKFTLLQMETVSQDSLTDIGKAFNHMGPKNGEVTFEAIKKSLDCEDFEADKAEKPVKAQ